MSSSLSKMLDRIKLDAKYVYWISSFITGMIFSVVFAASQLYRIQTVGMNALQLVLVGTTLEITTFVLEIPTGIVADVYSRRLSVIIGTFLLGIGFIVEGLMPVFWIVILAQTVWGAGWTFISGAHSAWIADEVGVENVGPIYLRSSQYQQIGNLVGIPIFIMLGNINYQLPILFGGTIFIVLAFFRILVMPETGFQRVNNHKGRFTGEMYATFVSGLNLAKRNPILLAFSIIAIFVGLYSEGYDRLSEAHLIQQFDFPKLPWGGDLLVSWFSIIRVLGIIMSLWGTQMINKHVKMIDHVKVARLLQIFYGSIFLGLIAFAWTKQFYAAVVSVLFINTLRPLTWPLINTWVNQFIDSKVRATVLSMTNQLDALGQMAGGPIVGFLGNIRNIRTALTTSALFILPTVPLYGWTVRLEKRHNLTNGKRQKQTVK